MSAIATLAPSRAKSRTMLAPMPEAPPVISATLFSSLMRYLPERGHLARFRAEGPHFLDPTIAAGNAGETPALRCSSLLIHPDRAAHHVADAGMDHKIGDPVERGRLAVDD